jgi:hypothetical protein
MLHYVLGCISLLVRCRIYLWVIMGNKMGRKCVCFYFRYLPLLQLNAPFKYFPLI